MKPLYTDKGSTWQKRKTTGCVYCYDILAANTQGQFIYNTTFVFFHFIIQWNLYQADTDGTFAGVHLIEVSAEYSFVGKRHEHTQLFVHLVQCLQNTGSATCKYRITCNYIRPYPLYLDCFTSGMMQLFFSHCVSFIERQWWCSVLWLPLFGHQNNYCFLKIYNHIEWSAIFAPKHWIIAEYSCSNPVMFCY